MNSRKNKIIKIKEHKKIMKTKEIEKEKQKRKQNITPHIIRKDPNLLEGFSSFTKFLTYQIFSYILEVWINSKLV